jgi:hypothetical protein
VSSPPTSLDTLLAIAIPLFLASSAYCSELKAKLQARERELEEGRAELVLLQEELRHTRSQLSEARSKLELYAEKEKLVEAAGREAEKPTAADSTCMSGDSHMTNSAVLEFLSRLAGLSVSRCEPGSDETVFHCKVTDGALTGHTFSLSVDSLSGEITYQPIQKSPLIPVDNVLADTACFPDYMQSRFLLNLLNTTFIQLES